MHGSHPYFQALRLKRRANVQAQRVCLQSRKPRIATSGLTCMTFANSTLQSAATCQIPRAGPHQSQCARQPVPRASGNLVAQRPDRSRFPQHSLKPWLVCRTHCPRTEELPPAIHSGGGSLRISAPCRASLRLAAWPAGSKSMMLRQRHQLSRALLEGSQPKDQAIATVQPCPKEGKPEPNNTSDNTAALNRRNPSLASRARIADLGAARPPALAAARLGAVVPVAPVGATAPGSSLCASPN